MSTTVHAVDRVHAQTAWLATGASIGALLSLTPGLPSVLRGILVGVFVLCGPGAAVMCHVSTALSLRASAIPAIGVATLLLATWAATETIGLHSLPLLVILALGSIAAASSELRLPTEWSS